MSEYAKKQGGTSGRGKRPGGNVLHPSCLYVFPRINAALCIQTNRQTQSGTGAHRLLWNAIICLIKISIVTTSNLCRQARPWFVSRLPITGLPSRCCCYCQSNWCVLTVLQVTTRKQRSYTLCGRLPNIFDLLTWKLANRLPQSWRIFAPILVVLRFFVSQLLLGTGVGEK